MADPEHIKIVKQGAEAIRQWQVQHPDIQLNLERADLVQVNLAGANLAGADLTRANLAGTNLAGSYLRGANLAGAYLREADLTGANLTETDLHNANLTETDLHDAHLVGTNLTGANLYEANLAGANFTWATLHRTFLLRVRGAHLTHGLETVRVTPAEPTDAANPTTDSIDFEYCERAWPERGVDWERLRVVGRLPLFGASYTALILIPIVFYGLALYNDKIDLVRVWAEQAVTSPDHPLHRLAPVILERLHRQPIPRLSLVVVVSTILLVVASTLSTLRCPSRIREFSRDQWCDELGRSLLHYWPWAWKERYVRLICAACYVLGGLLAIWVLGNKIWHTALFIWKHSSGPWW
jgi:hypothetical protein